MDVARPPRKKTVRNVMIGAGVVAVAGDPAILLADEPTGNLDSVNGEAMMGLLRELHRTGATICIVTHDPRYEAHADRSIHLFDGRVIDEQTAAALHVP